MKNNSLTLLTLIVAVYAGTMPVHATSIPVNNGSFENPALGGPFGTSASVSGTGLPGWNYSNPSGDMLLWKANTPYGNQLLEIGGVAGTVSDSIDQTVSGFTPFQFYTVTFSIASQWGVMTGGQVEVSFLSGSSQAAQDYTAPVVANFASWSTFSENFQATSSSVDIQFKEVANGWDDVAIDNVLISTAVPTPEPCTAFFGLALVGLGLARRRRNA